MAPYHLRKPILTPRVILWCSNNMLTYSSRNRQCKWKNQRNWLRSFFGRIMIHRAKQRSGILNPIYSQLRSICRSRSCAESSYNNSKNHSNHQKILKAARLKIIGKVRQLMVKNTFSQCYKNKQSHCSETKWMSQRNLFTTILSKLHKNVRDAISTHTLKVQNCHQQILIYSLDPKSLAIRIHHRQADSQIKQQATLLIISIII